MTKQKLELTWIGKHKRPKLEARILLEDPDNPIMPKCGRRRRRLITD